MWKAVSDCAQAYDTIELTLVKKLEESSCPVDEILIEDGRAVGVRLGRRSHGRQEDLGEEGVIAAVMSIRLSQAGRPKHVDPSFIQKVRDVSLKMAHSTCPYSIRGNS